MTDRVREALFSSLGSRVVGARVLDLYAGTGSMGLEALSRGAASATFVERDRRAVTALERNIDAVGLGGEVCAVDVGRYLDGCTETYDVAFVDPPYALPLASVAEIVERLEPLVTGAATVVAHRRWGDEPWSAVGSLQLEDRRRYGDADVWRYIKEEG